ncbi:MAG: hypothetical protein ACYC63_05680 [Armatimonadota bacterium]
MSTVPDRTQAPWRKQLEALLDGPYAGRGGRTALAGDLGITFRGLSMYMSDTHNHRDPQFDIRGRIKRLYEANGLDQSS